MVYTNAVPPVSFTCLLIFHVHGFDAAATEFTKSPPPEYNKKYHKDIKGMPASLLSAPVGSPCRISQL